MRNDPITCRAFRLLADREEFRKVGGGQMTWLDPRSVARDLHVKLLSDADATAASAKNAPD